MTNQEAQALADRLLDAYPQTVLRQQTPSLYAQYLLDMNAQGAEKAIDELIATSETLPTIAAIRGAIAQEELQLPTPWEAWLSISERGRQAHDLAKRAADMFGGTYNIRTADEPTIMRAQYLKAYEELRNSELRSRKLRRRLKTA